MKFPAYWAKATAEDVDRLGKPARISCWRWSDTSRQEAHESALAAARRLLQKAIAGDLPDRYGYGQRPMREEVKQRFTGEDGRLTAAITQNAYGALVLNTARVMFADLDFPAIPPGAQVRHFFKKWFDKQLRPPAQLAEEQTREAVAAFIRENPSWSARVYRTHSGLRVLAAHGLFDPAAESTLAIFRALSTDPLYVRLCKAQECFRARLTPKPWRCGHTERFIPWPRETEDERRRFDAWQADYIARQASFATCRFVETLGDGPVHPEAQTIIDIHDQVTRSGEGLELA
ncbi:MAG: hypothetical protein WD063_20010 [Pirellulales bacterium]